MREGEGCGQHGEDRLLYLFFGDQKEGLVVDVGAADGYWNSNSRQLLFRPGWKGLLIEPHPEYFHTLAATYAGEPRVVCVNCGVGRSHGLQTYHKADQTSTFVPAQRKAAEEAHGLTFTEMQVKMRPLSHILEENGIPEGDIDFLTIDVEGMNYEVWQTLDTNRWSPKLVCIEGKKYRMYGYKELSRLGGNTFYLREDVCIPL